MTKSHPMEADVKRAAKKLLTEFGWWHWMPVASKGFGTNGASDIHGLKRGIFIAVETKLKDEKGSPLQEQFGANVSNNGGYYIVCNMRMIENGQFREWLVGLDNLPSV